MANTNTAIPIEKVCNAVKELSAMGVWGPLTLNFEDGAITKISDGFIWKALDLEEGNITGAAEVLKKTLPIKKKFTIRTNKA